MELVSGAGPRCRGVRTCLDHSNIPKKMPLAPTHPPPCPEGAHSARASWKFYLLPRPLLKCMPNMGRVGSCKSKSWSRSTRSAWSRETLPDFRFRLQRSLTCPANCLRLLPAVFSKPLNLPGRCPGLLPADYPAF